jgi:hypothetical protein
MLSSRIVYLKGSYLLMITLLRDDPGKVREVYDWANAEFLELSPQSES